ncbi:MAG TPA: SRPBCC family protein [Nitrosopumilaceae archaeon]|nr:SRPBCC family protein [Nitrosopumilaceae archaeon]
MAEIKAAIEINASVDKVWEVVSDLDNDPKFWTSITSIRNISNENNKVKREVTLAKINKCLQTVILYPKEKVHTEWTKGIIKGTKDVILTPRGSGAYLEAVLDYKFTGMAGFMSGKITKDITTEVQRAVEFIKEKAEGIEKNLHLEERTHWADMYDDKKK